MILPLLTFLPKKATLIMVVVLVTLGVIFGAYWYVKKLESELTISRESISRLQQGIEIQQDTIKNMQAEAKIIASINQEYNSRLQQQNQNIRELTNKFTQSASGNTRDLGKLANSRPQLIENVINQATSQARRCLEIAMGAESTEQEKNDPKLAKHFQDCNN
jgi:predicted PurR-regulated permease PerM